MGFGKIFIANAFSLQMLQSINADITSREITEEAFNDIKRTVSKGGAVSAIGHQDTANVLGVPCNRVSIVLGEDDTLVVAQLMGGRLPAGSTKLPEGFSFSYMIITVKYR